MIACNSYDIQPFQIFVLIYATQFLELSVTPCKGANYLVKVITKGGPKKGFAHFDI